jgi:hypothetical protein
VGVRFRVCIVGLVASALLAACAISVDEYTSGWQACEADCGADLPETGGHDAAGLDTDGAVALDAAAVPDAPILLMQVNDVQPDGAVQTATIVFPDPQQSHDLNIVVVGWTNTVSSVMAIGDDAGNHYQRAVSTMAPATLWMTAGATQDIYYAADIASSPSNAVTVNFSGGVPVPSIDLRVVEFAGVSTLDALSAGTGALDASVDSAVTIGTTTAKTSVARELVVGAGLNSWAFLDAGPGFSIADLTWYGDLVEYQVVSQVGPYAATSVMNHHGEWILQMATFH